MFIKSLLTVFCLLSATYCFAQSSQQNTEIKTENQSQSASTDKNNNSTETVSNTVVDDNQKKPNMAEYCKEHTC
jgi:hypothetical protein